MADLDAIERTALLTAALRAAETRREDRLYTDPYAAAFAGEIEEFTGVSAPYEEPLEPELRLETMGRTPGESAATVIDRLEELNLLPERVESEL